MSFKDLLAIAMCAPFIITVFLFMWHHVPGDLELIKTLIPVVVVVLGGYFGQEVASSCFTRGNSNVWTGTQIDPTLTPTITPDVAVQEQQNESSL